MRDHIVLAQHKETLKWHGLFYRNIPTPSGSPRPVLTFSTKKGFNKKKRALFEIKKAFTEEQLKEIDIPEIEDD